MNNTELFNFLSKRVVEGMTNIKDGKKPEDFENDPEMKEFMITMNEKMHEKEFQDFKNLTDIQKNEMMENMISIIDFNSK
jgi:hypothetical protein